MRHAILKEQRMTGLLTAFFSVCKHLENNNESIKSVCGLHFQLSIQSHPPWSRLEHKTRCWTRSHTEPRQFRLAVNKWSTSIMNTTVCTRPPPVAAEHPLLQFQTFCMLTTLSSAELKTTIRVYISPVMWCTYFNQRADGPQEKERQQETSLVD